MSSTSLVVLFWYIYPIIVLFACNFLVTTFSLTQRFKIKVPDISIPFLLIGLHELSRNTTSKSILPYFLISVLLLGILIAVFLAYYKGEIVYPRYFKMFWRLVFLLSMVVYILVVLISIVF
ncbi:DUF3397 domain-containing protein [Enterococcus phoeniculicola]|jgi:hypothetical protein|uniref:Lipoprotein n=1 Tax=Enterococcus phoeniculicola ATCC BAA-412 TaxID=1158610 RepID=R3U680_9ENTE|nr:DUF3397 domain-containing protein [Enterococcus phoeniculicola]EOL48928.1 lipoprotein [Enterococcus phoeniculicola ATCC BAA-412]EOT72774.1 lipoprotein [Enterococcus phoeniculicola ATCC BAA-412]